MGETYVGKMAAMGDMGEDEADGMIEEIAGECRHYCNECPSYDETGETGIAFRTRGKSD